MSVEACSFNEGMQFILHLAKLSSFPHDAYSEIGFESHALSVNNISDTLYGLIDALAEGK